MESNKKALAIIAFCLVLFALCVAGISDIVIFAQTIFYFLAAIIIGAIVFIVGFILLLISFCLIFGFYLIESYGFWPLDWSVQAFHEIIADAAITPAQVGAFIGFRIGLSRHDDFIT